MFIAANANHHLSVQRSGRAGLRFILQVSFRSSERRRTILLYQNCKHLAPNEAKTKANLPPTQGGGPFHVRVVGLSLD